MTQDDIHDIKYSDMTCDPKGRRREEKRRDERCKKHDMINDRICRKPSTKRISPFRVKWLHQILRRILEEGLV